MDLHDSLVKVSLTKCFLNKISSLLLIQPYLGSQDVAEYIHLLLAKILHK